MEWDDVIYLFLLFASMGFGYYYKRIKNIEQKKWIGTGIGLVLVYIVSGVHIIHSFITVLVNSIIILFIDKRQCHLVSFVFSFLYLFFFRISEYFGVPYPPPHTNLVQMMLTLKLVGLAFEVNTANTLRKSDKADKTEDQLADEKSNDINPSFIDIFHYSFNYIGVLTGPYYRYRTFKDYFELPYCFYVNGNEFTLKKLVYLPFYAILFLSVSALYPLSYALTDDFYTERSWLYRFWYIWPNFFIFRMRMYIGLTLSECNCVMAGLGAYPAITEPRPGMGPTKKFIEAKKITKSETDLASVTYDYETVHNVNPAGADFCTTYRDGMKHWNICIQYWLATTVYKRFPSKKFRTLAVVVVSAVWHGVYSGYYVCICSVPFVLIIEDVYYKLFLKDMPKRESFFVKTPIEWAMWVFKMFAFSYFAIAFHMLDLPKIWQYYNSIYHAGIIIGVAMYFIGGQLLKSKRAKERKLQAAGGDSINVNSAQPKKVD